MTIEIIIALASVIVGFCLGRFGDWLNIKRSIMKEFLDNLYNPLVSLYKRATKYSAVSFSDLGNQEQQEFVTILATNGIYFDEHLSQLVSEFFMNIGFEDIQISLQDEETRTTLNQMYNTIIHYAFDEWHILTKKLYWPWYKRISQKKKFIMMLDDLRKSNIIYKNDSYYISNIK